MTPADASEGNTSSLSISPSSSAERNSVSPAAELAAIHQVIAEAIVRLDADGVIRAWNQGAERLFRYRASEILGRAFSVLAPYDRQDEFQEKLTGVLAGETFRDWETLQRRQDGSLIEVSIALAPIRQANAIIGTVVVVRDIGAWKRARLAVEESENRFRALMATAHASEERLRQNIEASRNQLRLITDTAPVLIAYVDRDQIFRFNNRHYARWFNRPLEQITDRSVREVLGEPAYEGVRSYVEAALAGENVAFEKAMPYSTTRHRYIHGDFVPDRDETGQVRGFVSVVTDITEIKRAQEEQARYMDEIQALNLRLRRAMTETHHRVKNNLQIIAALVGMQTINASETVPRSDLERIGLHVRSLATVHDLLTHEAKKDGEGNGLSAREILSKLLFMLSDAFGSHRLEYILDDIRLSARQSTSLGIIVNELVSNAMKYGRELVQVTLRQEDGRAVLEIADDGPGFPPEFVAAQAAHTGLELVENLSQWDLNGQTNYENRPGGGARITLLFPLPGA